MTGVDERTSAHGDSSVSKYVKGRPDEKPNWPGDGDCDVGEAAVTDISGGAREPCVATAVGIDSSSSGESPPSSSFSDGEDEYFSCYFQRELREIKGLSAYRKYTLGR